MLAQVFGSFPLTAQVIALAVNSLFIFDVHLLEGAVVPAFTRLDEFRLIFYTLNLRRHGIQKFSVALLDVKIEIFFHYLMIILTKFGGLIKKTNSKINAS